MTSTRNSILLALGMGLLAGLLAALGLVLLSSSATMAQEATSPDLLPGVDLVTEEVEPGVYRVDSDGIRDLSRIPDDRDRYAGGILDGNIVAGLDGSVWWFGPDGFFRVGEEGLHSWPEELGESFQPGLADIEVAADGTVWLAYTIFGAGASLPSGISSYDGRTWTTHWQGASDDESAYGVEVQQDGTVWAAWASYTRPELDENDRSLDPGASKGPVAVARLDADGWAVLPGTLEPWSPWPNNELVASEGGGSEVWLSDPLYGRLHRHDGEGWGRPGDTRRRRRGAGSHGCRRYGLGPPQRSVRFEHVLHQCIRHPRPLRWR